MLEDIQVIKIIFWSVIGWWLNYTDTEMTIKKRDLKIRINFWFKIAMHKDLKELTPTHGHTKSIAIFRIILCNFPKKRRRDLHIRSIQVGGHNPINPISFVTTYNRKETQLPALSWVVRHLNAISGISKFKIYNWNMGPQNIELWKPMGVCTHETKAILNWEAVLKGLS